MEFKWKIFAVALVFSLVMGALSNVSLFVFRVFDLSPEAYGWIAFIIGVATFLVSPVLLFASFYLIGGKIDLEAEFLSVVVPLFLGSWLGHLVGYFPLQFSYMVWYGGSLVGPWVLGYVWYGFMMAFSLEFFAGFAALSMAYIARKRSL